MKRLSRIMMMAAAFAVIAISCEKEVSEVDMGDTKAAPISQRGITPKSYTGNFVSTDDDQVCYDMSVLGYIGESTSEMRGFKIDPPVNFTDGNVTTVVAPKLASLGWTASSETTVLAFIIKGGPNYNVYNYVGSGFGWDNGLVSPLQKGKIPAISHYNVCYMVPPGELEGCTPGYWRNHADRWLGVAPSANFDATFGVTLLGPTVTLAMAVNNPNTYGTFAFHAVAALLNSYGGTPNTDGKTVEYLYTTAEVIALVQDAVANSTTNDAKNLLAAQNEQGCPLGGTRAVSVQ